MHGGRLLLTQQNDSVYRAWDLLWGLCNIIRRWLNDECMKRDSVFYCTSLYLHPTTGTDTLVFTSAFTVMVNPFCRCFMGNDAIYWSGSGFLFLCFQRNLISCSTQTSWVVLMGLVEAGGARDRICNRAEPPLILLELFRLHHSLTDHSKIRLMYKHMVHNLI